MMKKEIGLASAVRAAFKDLLEPCGYVKTGGMYFRHVGTQIHGIDFQRASHVPDFTINICFHYDFLPSFEEAYTQQEREEKSLAEFGVTDYLFTARLGSFVDGKDTWWSYEDDARAVVAEKTQLALDVLSNHSSEWLDPEVFFKLLPPRELEAIVDIPERDDFGPVPLAWFIIRHWLPSEYRLCEFLLRLCRIRGYSELEQKYAEVEQCLIRRGNSTIDR